jgi:hypothetical protein
MRLHVLSHLAHLTTTEGDRIIHTRPYREGEEGSNIVLSVPEPLLSISSNFASS